MNKWLIGYIVTTLFGLLLIVLIESGIVDGGSMFPSANGILAMFTIPEFFLIGSFFADHKLGQFSVEMIPIFLFFMSVKLTGGYGIASLISYLWNFKLEDVS